MTIENIIKTEVRTVNGLTVKITTVEECKLPYCTGRIRKTIKVVK